jgi:hypothetical protein
MNMKGPVRLYGIRSESLPVQEGQYLQTVDGVWWKVGRISWQLCNNKEMPLTERDFMVQTICLWRRIDMNREPIDPRWMP